MAQKKTNTQIENQVDEVFEKAENISDKVMDEASVEETAEPQPETEPSETETETAEPQPETEPSETETETAEPQPETEPKSDKNKDPLYNKIVSLLEENGRYAHIECGKYLTDGINPKAIHNFYMEFKDWGETSTSKDLELLDLLRQYCERE